MTYSYLPARPDVRFRVRSVFGPAAVALGILLALNNFWGARGVLFGMIRNDQHLDRSFAIFALAGAILLGVALTYGAFLLALRDDAGRYTIQVASGLQVLVAAVALICSLVGYRPEYGIDWLPSGRIAYDIWWAASNGLPGELTALLHNAWLPSLISGVPALLTFLVTGSRNTERWVARGRPSRSVFATRTS
ncbi:hypothetical protein [Nocardia arthritidis]|uniref:Uncharacterized protein n=1 Tax=Nocardia arthritidis TaxID=228602 RepID=A0A6G9Y4T8_9NOCA|nr:hypothetical protein [Nocardia arthritidis]QIS08086.1 hypothetical protein F5544_00770 [Nocardia arthritidis]